MSEYDKKILNWLNKHGYPLEFSVANTFSRHGFAIHQGYYYHDAASDNHREIDVVAFLTLHFSDRKFVRVGSVIECKYTVDKPWVVFSSPNMHIHPSSRIAQTLGSDSGEAILWAIAGDKKLQSLSLFSTKQMYGFSGVQALSEGKDLFYSALQSVTSATASIASRFNTKHLDQALDFAAIYFPLVVIKGDLYIAYYNNSNSTIELRQSGHARIYWRGSSASKFPITSIDIVTSAYLDEYVKQLKHDFTVLIGKLHSGLRSLNHAFDSNSLADFHISKAPRGIMSVPWVIRAIVSSADHS